MNVTELEQTLQTIIRLNPNVTQDDVLVMLHAAGVEERTIKEAKLLLPALLHTQSVEPVKVTKEEWSEPASEMSLPEAETYPELLSRNEERAVPFVEQVSAEIPPEELELLPVIAEEIHPQVIHHAELPPNPVAPVSELATSSPLVTVPQERHEEKVSLIPDTTTPSRQDSHIPENLPLKPFETSQHVWPFARYKEVFHGNVMPEAPAAPVPVETKKKVYYVPPDGEDKKLVIFASVLLVVVLLLVYYVHVAGRL